MEFPKDYLEKTQQKSYLMPIPPIVEYPTFEQNSFSYQKPLPRIFPEQRFDTSNYYHDNSQAFVRANSNYFINDNGQSFSDTNYINNRRESEMQKINLCQNENNTDASQQQEKIFEKVVKVSKSFSIIFIEL